MNFTREPIIETVITPREGCKLVIRSSKANGQEDYFVDAVEVVSFGHSFFFRSQERPKSFLVPVSDYELLELKETRMVLKNASPEKTIKIGGGKAEPTPMEPRPPQEKESRKRTKGRRGRRRDRLEKPEEKSVEALQEEEKQELAVASVSEEVGVEVAPSFISKLFPPPSTLIQDSLARYKIVEPTALEPSKEVETIFEHPEEPEDDSEQ